MHLSTWPLCAVALMEGMALAKTIVLDTPTKPDYEAIASAVFSHPNIATVVSASRSMQIISLHHQTCFHVVMHGLRAHLLL